MQFEKEAEELRKSAWPRCDQLAEQLASQGVSAVPALEYALKSRTHHVRSACLKAISRIEATRGRELAKSMLHDKAYEVRETAANLLGVPIPDK